MDSLGIRGLRLQYGSRTVLDGIDATFGKQELTVITGPNGSGKSLLLKTLAGLIPQGRESLYWNAGGKVHQGPGAVSLVFQDPQVQILGQTVGEDLRYGLWHRGLTAQEIQERVDRALTWTGLAPLIDQECRTLSGGEKRRLCVASILVLQPEFILFDEPFSNLDYPGVQDVTRLLLDLKEAGHGVIVVTHDLDRILAHADRLVLLKHGRIIADALPERVLPFLADHGVRRPPGKLRDMTWLP